MLRARRKTSSLRSCKSLTGTSATKDRSRQRHRNGCKFCTAHESSEGNAHLKERFSECFYARFDEDWEVVERHDGKGQREAERTGKKGPNLFTQVPLCVSGDNSVLKAQRGHLPHQV